MYIQCMKDGKCFDRYINGVLLDTKQTIPVSANIGIFPESNMLVCVYPTQNADIRWRDNYGETHVSHIYEGKGIAVNKKFLVNEQ